MLILKLKSYYESLIEITKEIDMNINPKKASGCDQIISKILKELSQKAMILLTHIYDAILRMKYSPKQWT